MGGALLFSLHFLFNFSEADVRAGLGKIGVAQYG